MSDRPVDSNPRTPASPVSPRHGTPPERRVVPRVPSDSDLARLYAFAAFDGIAGEDGVPLAEAMVRAAESAMPCEAVQVDLATLGSLAERILRLRGECAQRATQLRAAQNMIDGLKAERDEFRNMTEADRDAALSAARHGGQPRGMRHD